MDFAVAQIELADHLKAPPVLLEIRQMHGQDADSTKEEGNGIRYRALREEALRVGAQTGLAYRYGMIMSYLATVEPKLNVTFSFSGFVKQGRLLVPAVVETPNQFKMDQHSGQATVIRQAVTVEEEARIVSVVPTWRDYLWQDYSYPERPHPALLPRTNAEQKAWEDAINDGWKAGVSQADEIYDDRLAALTRAVEGRHNYITMEQKRMFDPAALRVVSNKVTFNGRTMNVGETIYTIQKPAAYTSATDWRPVWTR